MIINMIINVISKTYCLRVLKARKIAHSQLTIKYLDGITSPRLPNKNKILPNCHKTATIQKLCQTRFVRSKIF